MEKHYCSYCEREASFWLKSVKKWCCAKSSNGCPAVKEKKRQSSRARFGFDNPNQSPEIKAKREQTNREKYGSSYVVTTSFFKEKAAATLLKNYGVDNPSKSDVIKEKKKNTSRRRYGKEHPMQNPKVKLRLKQTFRKNWGVDHPFMLPDFQEKLRERMVELYGVDNPFKAPHLFPKIANGAIARYGKKGKGMVSDAESDWLDKEEVDNRQHFVEGKSGRKYCVDGYKNGIVYEFLGIYWHGHPGYFKGLNKSTKCDFEELFEKTKERIDDIKQAGFPVIAIWEDGSLFTGNENEEE